MKAVVAAFNQEKALVGAFSVIVKTGCGTDGSICSTSFYPHLSSIPGEEGEIPAGLSGKCPMRSKGSGNHCSGDLDYFDFINEFIQNLRAE